MDNDWRVFRGFTACLQHQPRDLVLTSEGLRVAVFYTKLHGRLLRPLVAAADEPPAPVELRSARATIDRVIAGYVDKARLGAGA